MYLMAFIIISLLVPITLYITFYSLIIIYPTTPVLPMQDLAEWALHTLKGTILTENVTSL